MNKKNTEEIEHSLTRMTEESIKTQKEQEEQLLKENKNRCRNINQDHRIMNEIIGIIIKNNLTFSESTKILDNVRRRIGIQTITTKCLYK